MATPLPPPGATRPRPPLAPPHPDPPSLNGDAGDTGAGDRSRGDKAGDGSRGDKAADGAGTDVATIALEASPFDAPPLVAPALEPPVLPPPRPEMAWPSVADQRHRRAVLRQRWILVIGFGLIVLAFTQIAYTAWRLGAPQAWVVWTSVALAPAALTALAALCGWRHALKLAVFVTAWQIVIATVALVLRPSVGVPQAVCALAAAAVTAAAWRCIPPEEPPPEPEPGDQPAEAEDPSSATDPPLAKTAG